MATHIMTPARRAALRKAQIASANKRRKYGVGSQVKRAARQQVAYRGASANVAVRRHVGSKGFQQGAKKAAKYTAIGLGAVALGAAGTAGAGYHTINKNVATKGYHQTRTGKKFTKQGGPGFTRVSQAKAVKYAYKQSDRNAKRLKGSGFTNRNLRKAYYG